MTEKKKFYKKWWFWTLIILLAIGFINQPSGEEQAEIKAQQEAEEKLKAEEATEKEAERKEKEEKELAEAEESAKDETNNVNQTEDNEAEIGKDSIAALKSNDFHAFVEEYKKLGKNKTPVWDNHLYGKKVSWTGTVVRAGSSQLFVYGGTDYNGETWDELGEQDKLYNSFVAKYADGTAEDFKKLQTGDKVTVEGDLESRGDFDLGFNWKIYNATLK